MLNKKFKLMLTGCEKAYSSSTHVTDGQTELQWLRRAESIAAFACKNHNQNKTEMYK